MEDPRPFCVQAAFTEFSGMKATSGLPFAKKAQTFSSQIAAQKSTVSTRRLGGISVSSAKQFLAATFEIYIADQLYVLGLSCSRAESICCRSEIL